MLKDSIAFSGFAVSNLDKAKAFYEQVLGLDVTENEMGLLELHINGGGTRILVYPKPDHTPATYTILNFTIKDIDKTVDELVARGVNFEHYDMEHIKTDTKGICRNEDGPLIAWFTDPSGNILSVLQER